MPRHRRMLAPINSIKHYVGQPRFVIALGIAQTLEIVDVVNAPVSSTREKVTIGAMIKAIHLEYWIAGGGGTSGSTAEFVFTLEKIPAGQANPTFADMLNLGGYDNKKNILYTTQGIVVSSVGTQSIPIIRDWVLIPKGKQRMGQGDRIVVTFATVEESLAACGMSIYKEYV